MNLTMKEIQGLAQLERDMEAGKQAFVLDSKGNRWAFSKDVLLECNIQSGQMISDGLLRQVMRVNIANLDTKLAIENMKGNKDECK